MTTVDRHEWRKSSYSGGNGGECVEVRFTPGSVQVRDSKYLRDPANDPASQPIITVPIADWPSFLTVSSDHSAVSGTHLPAIDHTPDGSTTLRAADGTTLTYTAAEWSAFLSGARAGEFAAA